MKTMKYDDKLVKRLEAIAQECRRIALSSGFGHGGGIMSLQDIAVFSVIILAVGFLFSYYVLQPLIPPGKLKVNVLK